MVAMNVALGAKNSKVDIIVDERDAGSNHVKECTNGNTVMNTLDGVSIHERIDFVKIDVEGYEFEVLKGGEKTITKSKPDIFIEIFDVNYDRVNDLLKQMGYECDFRTEQDYLYKYKE